MRHPSEVRPVVTGPIWMGGGTGSIQTTLEEIIAGANRELHVASYSISDGASGLLGLLANRLRDGVRVTMIVERLASQHGLAAERLATLAREYPVLFRLYEFVPTGPGSLHAKCLVADREHAFVGSANLSFNGLVQNYELGVVIHGPAAADLAGVMERLIPHPDVERVSPTFT